MPTGQAHDPRGATTTLLGRLVLDDVVMAGRIDVDGSRIAGIAPDALGARGPYIAPGLVDIHVHGWAGHEALEGERAIAGMARALLRHGVTSFLPTAETAPIEALVSFAAGVRRYRDRQADGSDVLGFNLEGPFISPRRAGAQNQSFIMEPTSCSERALRPLIDGLKVWTIAPELQGATALIAWASANGVAVSLGHSDASAEDARRGMAAGARSVTHLFNAMSGMDHHRPGLAAAAMSDARVQVELIADGVHVDRALWPTVLRCASPDRLVLVSDAVPLAGMGDVTGTVGGLDAEVRDGVCRLVDSGRLAGSVIALDTAVGNLVAAGASLPHAIAAATRVPLDLIGVSDRGRLAPGQRADLVLLDDALSVTRVMQRGQWVTQTRPTTPAGRSAPRTGATGTTRAVAVPETEREDNGS